MCKTEFRSKLLGRGWVGGGGVLDVPFYHNSTGLYLFLILICSVIFNGFLIRNILELMI